MLHALKVLLVVSTMGMTVMSCSTLAPLALKAATGAVTDKGIEVDSQIGKTNTKQVVGQQVKSGRDTVTNKSNVRSDAVDSIVINETPFWLIIVALIGWLAPSPREIARWVRNLFARK